MENLSWQSFFCYEDDYIDKITAKLESIKEEKKNEATYKDFNKIDIIHPGGHEGVDKLFEDYAIPERSKVLEVGVGMGGTSRHLCYDKRVSIFGLDFVQRLVDISTEINRFLRIEDKVVHVQGDACTISHEPNCYDLAIVIGVFVHVDNDQGIINTLSAIKPGGLLYIEDYYFNKDPSEYDDNERAMILSRGLIGTKKPENMRNLLTSNGMEILEMSEFGSNWSLHAWDRANALAKACKEGSIQLSDKHFHEYIRVSPQLTPEVGHLGIEEIRNRWPFLCEIIDPEEVALTRKKLTGVYRVVAKKL